MTAPELLSLFTASFVTFFVLIDAVGVAPIFASLTARGSARYRRRMAIKAIRFWRSLAAGKYAYFHSRVSGRGRYIAFHDRLGHGV